MQPLTEKVSELFNRISSKNMKLFIFRTNIKTEQKANALIPLFKSYSSISNWSIDLEDRDKVLRVETVGSLEEHDVIKLVKERGFHCEALPD